MVLKDGKIDAKWVLRLLVRNTAAAGAGAVTFLKLNDEQMTLQ